MPMSRIALQLAVALLLALAAVRGAAADANDAPVDAETEAVAPEHRMTRETYIWQTVQRLRAFTLGDPMERIDIWDAGRMLKDQPQAHSILVIDGSGYLQFADGSWLAFITHTSHCDHAGAGLTLAIDETGGLWVSQAHVCGKLGISLPSKEIPRSRADFLRAVRGHDRPELGFLPFPYEDPSPLPPAVQACLDRGDFEGVLREMPEVRRDWEREQAALAALPDYTREMTYSMGGPQPVIASAAAITDIQEDGKALPATASRWVHRIGNPRLISALPDAQGRYFDRVTGLRVMLCGQPLTPDQEGAVLAYHELDWLDFRSDYIPPLPVPDDVPAEAVGDEDEEPPLEELPVLVVGDTRPALDLMPGPAFYQRLASLPRLRCLDCPVPAEALPAVAALAGLLDVNLEGSTVDDAALLAFADTPGGELQLNVEGTAVTQAGAEALVARRPSTSVYLGRGLGSIESPDLTAAEKERQRAAELERTLQKQAAADSFEPPPDFNW